jgi:hypothetical protein
VELIEADVEQVPEAEVRNRYLDYLPVVALLDPLSERNTLSNSAKVPLEQLAAKSDALAADVQSYYLVTEDLLRWRKRVAQAYAAKERQRFALVRDRIRTASQGAAILKYELLAPAWQVLQIAAQKLVGQAVVAEQLIGLPTDSKFTVSRYRDHSLVQLAIGNHLDEELEQLRGELFLDGGARPLTLSAATAVATAERGDLIAAGGYIQKIALEGTVTRFGQLRPTAWPLAFGIAMSDAPTSSRPLRQILYRCIVAPTWLQHEYFFVTIDGSPAP